MDSLIAKRLRLRHPLLGVYRCDAPPAGAKGYRGRTSLKGGFGCSMHLVAHAFKEGKAVYFTPDTLRCPGAAFGFGLGRPPWGFPGGQLGSARLISCGNSRFEDGRAAVEELRRGGASREVLEEFGNGEGFKRDPEAVMGTFMAMPRIPEAACVVMGPLSGMPSPPEAVIALADALQLSALAVLANYSRKGYDGVSFPFAAGCMSVGLLPLAECASDTPRAVVGLADVSARVAMRRLLGRDLLSFAMPWALYSEMESDAEASFLSRPAWMSVAGL
jgi:hypothetical protein